MKPAVEVPVHSRLYRGTVMHSRFTPAAHTFRYAMTYLYADLDELVALDRLSPLFSVDRPNVGSFRREDFLPSEAPLKETVFRIIAEQKNETFCGRVRLLAMPRSLGYALNPIALFFCFDEAERLRWVVAEVTNTPWGERHVYVVDPAAAKEESAKAFHVSPFMPMDTSYRWRISDPGHDLTVSIDVMRHDKRIFSAAMKLSALPVTGSSLTLKTLLQPHKGAAAIYRQAAALARKKVPFYLHPRIRERLLDALRGIEGGQIVVNERGRREMIGDGTGPTVTVTILDERFYTALMSGGSIGAAEAYMQGYWQCNDLTTLLRLVQRNRTVLERLNQGAFLKPLHRLGHVLNRDTVKGSKKNIAAHYDLGNELFQTFLDPTLTYSAGIFRTPQATMVCASTAKLDRICRHLELGPDDHVLEIGTGWGSFALHAARQYGCRVTTTTISEEQHALASNRIAEAGLSDRVELLKKDYRHLEGNYDKLVSIEMIEAVGLEHLREYFSRCAALLRPDGRMMIQAITMSDQHYDFARRNVDFIQKYIFPGGALPSVTALTEAATRASDLRLFELFDMTEHYAETLRRWRDEFFANIDRVRSLGYDDVFVRMWEYYLSYCEAGFEERHIGCVQAAFHKPGYRRSIAC